MAHGNHPFLNREKKFLGEFDKQGFEAEAAHQSPIHSLGDKRVAIDTVLA